MDGSGLGTPEGSRHYLAWDAKHDGACSDRAVLRLTVRWQAPSHTAGAIEYGSLSTISPPFPVGATVPSWYRDGDGLGDSTRIERSGWPATGFVAVPGDCDDTDAEIGSTCPPSYEIGRFGAR